MNLLSNETSSLELRKANKKDPLSPDVPFPESDEGTTPRMDIDTRCRLIDVRSLAC